MNMVSPGQSMRMASCLAADSSSIVTVASRGRLPPEGPFLLFCPSIRRKTATGFRACYLPRRVLMPDPPSGKVAGRRAKRRRRLSNCELSAPRLAVRSGRPQWCVSLHGSRASVGPPGGSGCLGCRFIYCSYSSEPGGYGR